MDESLHTGLWMLGAFVVALVLGRLWNREDRRKR